MVTNAEFSLFGATWNYNSVHYDMKLDSERFLKFFSKTSEVCKNYAFNKESEVLRVNNREVKKIVNIFGM